MQNQFPNVYAWWRLSLRKNFASAKKILAISLVAALATVAIGLPILLATRAVSAQQKGQTATLAVIRVDTPPENIGPALTVDTINKIRQLPHVEDVVISLKASVYGETQKPWNGYLTPLRPWLLPPGIDTKTLNGEQVIAPATMQGADLTPYKGKELPISYVKGTGPDSGKTVSGTLDLVATYPAKWSAYGPNVLLASPELVIKLHALRYATTPEQFMQREGVNEAWVKTESESDVEAVSEQIRQLGFEATAQKDLIGALPGILAAFPKLFALAAAGMGLLLALQISLTVKNGFSMRKKEFGLLRMRGYTTRDLRKLITLEVCTASTTGAILGSLLGAVLGYLAAAKLLPREFSLKLDGGALALGGLVTTAVVAAIIALSLLVALLSTRRLRREDPFLLVMKS